MSKTIIKEICEAVERILDEHQHTHDGNSPINIIRKEIENSSNHPECIIIHHKLSDRLIEDVRKRGWDHMITRDPHSKVPGYKYRGLTVYVSSDNVGHEQVIVF